MRKGPDRPRRRNSLRHATSLIASPLWLLLFRFQTEMVIVEVIIVSLFVHFAMTKCSTPSIRAKQTREFTFKFVER